ncbi:hypothetical protein MMC11_006659 [Xylographa trunciseda]|nr:hypothetical protein [Xylographa trunciseda]
MSSSIASLTAGLTPQQILALQGQNHDVEVYTCAIVFSVLSILAVAMRVTSRHMKRFALEIDDVLVMFALVISLAQTIYICIGVRNYGLGRHLWTLNETQFANFNKLWYTVGTLQCTALLMTKISLLILYHRIFITPGFRLATKVLGVVMILWWIGTFLADTLICIPISSNWDPTVPAHCGNKQLLAKIPPIPWIATDLIVLLMPVPMVWKLHLPRLQRIGLAGLFLLGGLATFASCYRYSLLFYQPEDVTYNLIPASIWTIIEIDVTIITVCLIVSRPWLLRIFPSRLVSLVHKKLASVRKSLSNRANNSPSPGGSQRRWLFSSFRRIEETPPAITAASVGAPFEFDVEKGMGMETKRGRMGRD